MFLHGSRLFSAAAMGPSRFENYDASICELGAPPILLHSELHLRDSAKGCMLQELIHLPQPTLAGHFVKVQLELSGEHQCLRVRILKTKQGQKTTDMTQSLSKASTRAGRVDRRWNVSECTWVEWVRNQTACGRFVRGRRPPAPGCSCLETEATETLEVGAVSVAVAGVAAIVGSPRWPGGTGAGAGREQVPPQVSQAARSA